MKYFSTSFALLFVLLLAKKTFAQYNPFTDPSLVLRLDDQSPFYTDSAGTIVCIDGDDCGYWGDLSGKGHHARAVTGILKPTFRANTLNNRKGLEWNGVNQPRLLYLGTPKDLCSLRTSNYTIIVAASQKPGNDGILFNQNKGSFSDFTIGVLGGVPWFKNGTTVPKDTFFTYAVSYNHIDEVGGLNRFYQNGSLRGAALNGGSGIDTTNGLSIGDFTSGSGYSWGGNIFAVLMFSRTLTPSELWQTNQYLRNRYAQPWPGGVSDKIIIWDGNSISTNDVIPQLVAKQLNIPPEAVMNFSWGAKSTVQMSKYGPNDIDALIPYLPEGKQLISVGWEMTNDLLGTSAATGYKHLVTYAEEMKKLGLQHITATCLPRRGNAGFEDTRNSINEMIRKDHSYADAVADVAADPVIGIDGQCTGIVPLYYGDGVHPTPKGDSIIAPYFTEAIKSLIVTAINNTMKNSSLNIYPNPASDYIKISVRDNIQNLPVEISFTDCLGAKLLTQHVADYRSDKINIQTLLPGIYIVSIISGEHKEIKRLVKRTHVRKLLFILG